MTLERPSFEDFDIYHAGVSGGKDSTALALWLRFESGLPLDKIDITMCDTENEDALTYAYVQLLQRIIAPLEIKFIHPPLGFWDLAFQRRRFPARRARFCTQELKIIPTRAYVLELQRAGHNVLMMNGVRRDEGNAANERAEALDWEFDWAGFGAWIHRPIAGMTIEQVWELHKRYIPLDDVIQIVRDDAAMPEIMKDFLVSRITERGIGDNPLYAMGARRVGCFPCINSVKGEIRVMAKYRPERVEYIAEQEIRVGSRSPFGFVGFFHANMVPELFRRKKVSGTAIRSQKFIEIDMATIYDVVDWSHTKHGGKQYEMDFDIPASACDIGGMCE